jgi:putative membrane protein
MTLRLVLAALHLLALGVGLWAVLTRGQSLRAAVRELPRADALRRAFRADAHWGAAAGLWIVTGLWRLFGETEKSVGYYMTNHAFFAKMGFLVVILLLELWPMITLIRWRRSLGAGASPETFVAPATANRLATISYVQALLVVCMVFAAVAMARGVGAR